MSRPGVPSRGLAELRSGRVRVALTPLQAVPGALPTDELCAACSFSRPLLSVALALSGPAGAAGSSSIAALQVALHAHGFYPAAVDGVPGPLTTTGLTNLQRVKGIPITGRVERKTRSALGSLGRPLLRAAQARGWRRRLGCLLARVQADPVRARSRPRSTADSLLPPPAALARFQAKKLPRRGRHRREAAPRHSPAARSRWTRSRRRRWRRTSSRRASRHLQQHPPEAPEDRRPGHSQRPPHPHRHGLELPRRRGVPPRSRPIMRLIPTTPPVPQRHQPTPAPIAPRRNAQPCPIPAPRPRGQHGPVPRDLHEGPGEKCGLDQGTESCSRQFNPRTARHSVFSRGMGISALESHGLPIRR